VSRLLFFVAIAALVYLLLRSYRNNSTPPAQQPPRSEDMVVCAQCGVHVPKGESVQAQGRNFCCAAHRDAYRD